MFRHVFSLNSASSLRVSNSIPRNRNHISSVNSSMHTTPPNRVSTGLEIRGGDFSRMQPFFASPLKFDYQPFTMSSDSSPLSLRLMQLREKQENLPFPKIPPPNLCSLGSSVLSLASLIAETQRVVGPNNSSSCSTSTSSIDSGYSIIWLFRKVFVSSPALMVGILELMGESINVGLKSEINWVIADMEWDIIMQQEKKKFSSWSQIGVEIQDVYEKLIKENESCSLILSNYAQFLYQIQKNHDRAEEYFKRAVEAEPIDGEAKSRYALFLWEERGDLEKAEEMFLEAIEADSGNSHHLATYARFLWTTGGTDTCVPFYDEMKSTGQ